ncbi:iron ABC transporter permease [Meiothermus sp. CFH 77666]|uniref:FecCD family ABC transporter permease n=1 Tax=Meiothermus sp. CFH 77666 TaxID=2817942 RepID=UPI001AA0765E|nr:iron ABC transporter permease [Meiothermus sp. CFH 77666]MBO1437343.1 iron ABC transporter permease [Meiothermus sp. CFH 77666]
MKFSFTHWMLVLGLLLLSSITLAVMLGPVPIAAGEVWRIAWHRLGGHLEPTWSAAQENIVWYLRFPRVLLGVVVGASLAVAGVVMQALVRNPLADPYLLGVSGGASTGAVLALATGWLGFAGLYGVSIGAFVGSLASLGLVLALARLGGQMSPTRLILAGVAVAYLFSGLTSLITLTGERELARAALSWLLGSLSGSQWRDLGLPSLVLLLCTLALLFSSRALNAIAIGDETATTLGLEVPRLRLGLILLASLLTAVAVAVAGAVGFIGLMLPHMARFLSGADHRRLLPTAALLGGLFTIWVDVGARMLFAPQEVPLGVITALLGAPFFLWLMLTRREVR